MFQLPLLGSEMSKSKPTTQQCFINVLSSVRYQSEIGHLEEGRNRQQSSEAARGRTGRAVCLSGREWYESTVIRNDWQTCLNNALSSDRPPWRGRITWRPCGNSRGSSCWRSDWQDVQFHLSVDLFISVPVPTRRGPTIVMLLFLWFLFFLQRDRTCGPFESWTSFRILPYLTLKIQKLVKALHTPPRSDPMTVTKEHVVFERPHLNATDQVNFLFLFLFFLWMFLFLSGAQKCSPQMCFTEQFQMFLRPAQACTGVPWDTVGVVLLSSGGPLTTKARDQPWAWELTQSFCLFFSVESCIFVPVSPQGQR